MPALNEMPLVNIALMLFSSAVTFFLLLGLCLAEIKKRPFIKHFIALLVAHIFMQLGEAAIWAVNGLSGYEFWLRLACAAAYGASDIVMWLFTSCLTDFLSQNYKVSRLPEKIVRALSLFLLAGSLLSFKWNIFFTITPQGTWIEGAFAAVDIVLSFVCFVLNLWFVLYYRRFFTKRAFVLILSYCLLPLAATLLHDIWYPVPIYLIMTLLLISIFISFHSDLEKMLARQEKELVESRIAVMTSQIQPHFLYNSLNSIYHLCDLDVRLAQEAVSNFSDYLRGVLDSLKRATPISFAAELRNVQTYLELEKLRFGEELQIVYDISETQFFVPALTVQTLVENAVKHGLCMKEDGGTLTLKTRAGQSCYEIIVQDDGVGFAPEQLANDGRLHVGLENTRQRLAAMVGGTLTISSTPGIGTKAVIRIPKETKEW